MRKVMLILMLLVSTGCATVGSKSTRVVSDTGGASSDEASEQESGPVTPVDAAVPAAQNDLNDNEADLVVIPHEFNNEVQKWINYFTGRGRHHMDRYLARSSRYLPKMKEILRKNSMPEDLVYISLIESGFSPTAHSWANAVGYWQFIRGTGKRYGLHIDSLVDERRDFILSTEAAAQYYKELYSLFGSWYLAIASYNVGENKVKRSVMKHFTRDFWTLARKRALPKETVNYVPKYLAARMISKHPERFGFTNIPYEPALAFDEIKVSTPVDLKKMAAEMGVDEVTMLGLNPMFVRGVTPLYRGKENVIRVPVGMAEKGRLAVNTSAVSESVMMAAASQGYFWYRIRRGDTISRVAKRHRTTVSRLRDLNGIGKGGLRVGRRIKVPEGPVSRVALVEAQIKASSETDGSSSSIQVASNERSQNVRHRVKRGDTLTRLANVYNTTVPAIVSANSLKGRAKLRRGQILVIPTLRAETTMAQAQSKALDAIQSGTKTPGTVADGIESAGVEGDKKVAQEFVASLSTYRVQPGDTLMSIARRFKTNVDTIRDMNKLGRRSVLYAGQELKVPSSEKSGIYKRSARGPALVKSRSNTRRFATNAKIHVIKRGETLFHIARRYGVSVSALARKNGMDWNSKVKSGVKLAIPKK